MTGVRPAVERFVADLAALKFKYVFNPYAEACDVHDTKDAPAIRRRNLSIVLDAALTIGVDSIWIARDLGYRGGRRTGLALTDDVHLAAHASLFDLPSLDRATRGPVMGERTARVIWQALSAMQRPVFLWNVFPLHPFECGDPMSNRCHTRTERQACRPLLMCLLGMLQPRSVLAIGRDAELALADLGVPALKVRHPSYGGQSEFLEGVFTHYGVEHASKADALTLF
jgi:hypothetical protein